MSSGPVTLLFTDLVDSTELLQRAGDERAQRVFRAHHRLLKTAVTAHGGQEVKWLGDGLMTAFVSTADAVRCAVAMQQAARRRAAGERLQIRIGLHAGETLREETDYFGTPVVTARRLCDQAAPGQILCSSLVVELLEGRQAFSFRDSGSLQLKGLASPVRASEVVYQHDAPAVLLAHTPFVGRAAELRRLKERLLATRAGSGGLVLLAGEPGIGKTRTMEEFVETAREDGALVLNGRCYEGEWAPPFGPFVEALAECARASTPEQLRSELKLAAAPLARLIPALRAQLPEIPEPVALQPDEERFRLLDSVAQYLIAVSARVTVVLMLDDLHWADKGTVSMLRHVARFAPSNRMLLVGCYRDVEVERMHPLAEALGTLPRETSYEHLALAGLVTEEVQELLDNVADRTVPAALVQAISAETSGNPFFIREVLLHLVEERKILQRDGRWVSTLTIAEMGIPQSVRQVVQRRLARLSGTAQQLLGAASGFAGGFRLDLAARVAGLDEAASLDALDEALAAQLLRSAGSAVTFDFTHALVRHTLYAQLSAPRQARLHRQIAGAMEESYGADAVEHADEIARHYHLSASVPGADRGVDYAVLAAERAEQSAAFAEATRYLRIALELSTSSDGRRPRLLARLALALAWSLNPDEAEQTAATAAAAIATTEGDGAAAEFVAEVADSMWSAAVTPKVWSLATRGLEYCGTRRDTVWARLMVYDIQRRESADPENPGIPVDTPERREVTKRLWDLPEFRNADQTMFACMDFRSREDVLTRAGDNPLALMCWAGEFRRALPILERRVTTALERGQIAVACFHLTQVSWVHAALGDLEASSSAYTRAAELHERIGNVPWLRAFLTTAMGFALTVRGEGWELILAGAEAVVHESAPEMQWAMAVGRAAAGYAAAQLGRRDEALRWLAPVIPAIDRAPGSAVNYPLIVAVAVSALECIDCTDHAETLERNLRAKWLEPDFRYPLTDARWSLAMLCGVMRRFDEAAEWFAKSRVIVEEQGSRPVLARLDFHEARMYARRGAAGDGQRAAGLLRSALEQFREIGMSGFARRAEDMLAHAEAAAPAGNLARTDRLASKEQVPEALALGVTTPTGGTPSAESGTRIFRREGDYWTIVFDGKVSRLKDARGLHYVAQLLRRPGVKLAAMELLISINAAPVGPATSAAFSDGLTVGDLGSAGPLLDERAKSEYKRRLTELREELAEAETLNDTGRAAHARGEIEMLTDQLSAAVGLGGRDRQAASHRERVRQMVTKRIKAILKNVAAADPALGHHLNTCISTGTFCMYDPPPASPDWTL